MTTPARASTYTGTFRDQQGAALTADLDSAAAAAAAGDWKDATAPGPVTPRARFATRAAAPEPQGNRPWGHRNSGPTCHATSPTRGRWRPCTRESEGKAAGMDEMAPASAKVRPGRRSGRYRTS
jgi:hypothetical protein